MADSAQDFAIFAGDDVTVAMTLSDAAGAALDLTGAVLEWGMAPLRQSAASLAKSSADSDQIAITDAAGGLAEIYLAAADTGALAAGLYRHLARITDASGKIETLLTGLVTVSDSIL